MKPRIVLGIESSCDECSASVVAHVPGTSRVDVLGLSTYSQIELHRPYGGVVPEVASRNHLETINHMIREAMLEAGTPSLDAIAVTNRPGLVGALLVGVSAAKAISYAMDLPLIAVHHLEGHAASVFLCSRTPNESPHEAGMRFPMMLAIVSGGHTNLYRVDAPPGRWARDWMKQGLIGRSRDDAAGEAFDKTAKLLGFPYPGGVWIDRTARERQGDGKRFDLPRALPQKDLFDFSFSGLKTAVALEIQKLTKAGILETELGHLCASIQEAIIDQLLGKISRAIRKHECRSLVIVGGVAANSRLRERLGAEWRSWGLSAPPGFPSLEFCTDNAAMIAAAGAFRLEQGHVLTSEERLTLNAIANPEL